MTPDDHVPPPPRALGTLGRGVVGLGLLAFVTSSWWIDPGSGRTGSFVASGCAGSVAILLAVVFAILASRSREWSGRIRFFAVAAVAALAAYAAWVLALSGLHSPEVSGGWTDAVIDRMDIRVKGDIVIAGIVLVVAGLAAWLSRRDSRRDEPPALDEPEDRPA